MKSSQSELKYEETWVVPFAPLVFFLPMFYKYSVIVTEDTLTFGYGFKKPWGLTSKKVSFKDINIDSINIGCATWKENVLMFGGYGIKLGLNGTTAYNAKNGDYIEFVTTKGWKYRFVSNDVESVASLLKNQSSLQNTTVSAT